MKPYRLWTRLALLNLLIVSAAGVLLRYKILFPLPIIDHKNLLHGHSHFAFSGWVSLALFTAIVATFSLNNNNRLSAYTKLFWLGQLAAFGMLFTFPFMGYKGPSIIFSTLSIIFSYFFAAFAWKDISRSDLPQHVSIWFKAALAFYVLSSLGAFNLAWLMATKSGTQPWYIGSAYFFLHFQYNGWFLFSIIGLFFYQLDRLSISVSNKRINTIFILLFFSCFPAFLLSALWMKLPAWVHLLAIIAALMQLTAIVIMCQLLFPLWKKLRFSLFAVTKWLWLLAFTAFTIKFLLQGLSVFPALSFLAFGFRPIVIGYLHLILLGFVTFFLLGYLVQQRFITNLSKLPFTGLILFVTGVLLNELFLMIQGIAAINYTGFPVVNYLLMGAVVLMFTGLAFFSFGQWRKGND